MGVIEVLRGINEPRVNELTDEQVRQAYSKMIGTRQLDAALRVLGLDTRQSLTYDEVRSVLIQLAGTALLGRTLDELFGERS